MTEFRVTALRNRSRPTISGMNDWRVGLSNTFTNPRPAASTNTIQMRMVPVPTRMPKVSASSPASVWVMNMTRRLLRRSASRPPHGPNRNIGPKRAAVVSPSTVPELVSCRTRNDWAIVCIQVPLTEMSCPKKYRR